MAKIKKLSKEEIIAINKEALNKIKTIEVKRGRKSESEEFLLDIKEVLTEALNKDIPFTQISKLIKELYSCDISVNILKSFAKNHLGYIPKKRAGANGVVKAIKNKKTVDNNSNIEDENEQRKKGDW